MILFLFDLSSESFDTITKEINVLENQGIPYLAIGNKSDLAKPELIATMGKLDNTLAISAKSKDDLHDLEQAILAKINLKGFSTGDTIVTNLRHHEQLVRTKDSLQTVIAGIDAGVTNDFTAMDIRQALHHLGEITGQITTDDLLENIFSKFCIGK